MFWFVSGGVNRLQAYPGQGSVATAHEFLCTCQNMANLRAQFTVGVPARLNFIRAKQRARNITVRGAGLLGVECLQGAQMQQSRARG